MVIFAADKFIFKGLYFCVVNNKQFYYEEYFEEFRRSHAFQKFYSFETNLLYSIIVGPVNNGKNLCAVELPYLSAALGESLAIYPVRK